MKRTLSIVLAIVTLAALFAGCAPTPVAGTTDISLEDVTWTIAIEGVSGKTEYTLDMAKEKKETKIYAQARNTSTAAQGAPQVSSSIYQGVKVSDMLEQLGVTSFSSLTFVDTDGGKTEIPADLASDAGSIIAWKENLKNVISGSSSHVAFAASKGDVKQFVRSIEKIIVNP